MPGRLLLACSAVFNALLLVAFLTRLSAQETVLDEPPSSGPSVARDRSEAAATVERGLGWRQLTKGSYAAARDQLRRDGVPEAVIEDAIVGAINRRYGPKLVALRRTPWRYWESIERRRADELSRNSSGNARRARWRGSGISSCPRCSG